MLQARRPVGWEDFYAFTLEPQHDVDYEVASYYVSTHPDSPFTRTLAAQLATREARYRLRNREFIVESASGIEARTVADTEVPELLTRVFGLALPAEMTLPDRPWRWGA